MSASGGPLVQTDDLRVRLNKFARIPVCGLVADYNATGAPEGPDRLEPGGAAGGGLSRGPKALKVPSLHDFPSPNILGS